MSNPETLVILVAAAVLGGALGAKLAKAQPWKGAVSTFAGSVAFLGVGGLLGMPALWIQVIAALIATGTAGGALKLSGAQLTNVALGGLLFAGGVVLFTS